MGFVIVVVCILIAMVIHEFMHAFTSHWLGDTTARDEGRLTLNPLKHIDPIGTVLLPAVAWFLFGFLVLAAKPVPFNPARVKYGEYGGALIALAGPLSNIVLAFATAGLVHVGGLSDATLVGQIANLFIQLNVSLFVFNLIPIPPLDGSRILYAFAPESVQNFMERIEPFGFVIIMALIVLTGFSGIIRQINQAVLSLLS